ncbi:MAG: serine/threonine-protein kinase, partial [Gemmataceae bacterium]
MNLTQICQSLHLGDAILAAYIQHNRRGPAAIARMLPLANDTEYLAILKMLLKSDFDSCKASGQPFEMEPYLAAFPVAAGFLEELFASPLHETPIPRIDTSTHLSQKYKNQPCLYPSVGDEVDGYFIQEEIGRGAFGRVYIARENYLARRKVVLKITTRPSLESETLARLQHPNIVPIYAAFQQGSRFCILMPYLGRSTLADSIHDARSQDGFPAISGTVFLSTVARISGRNTQEAQTITQAPTETASDAVPLPSPPAILDRQDLGRLNYLQAVLRIILGVTEGLEHAHSRGILHLDLKPQNVLFTDDGIPMLLDFNLAIDIQRGQIAPVGGTWPYMSLEQIQRYAGERDTIIDARSDLFSLGVIFYELLCGQKPFASTDGSNRIQEAIEARRGPIPKVRNVFGTYSYAIDAILSRLLAAQPEQRYSSATELVADLKCLMEGTNLHHAWNPSIQERTQARIHQHRQSIIRGIFVLLVATILGAGILIYHDSE